MYSDEEINEIISFTITLINKKYNYLFEYKDDVVNTVLLHFIKTKTIKYNADKGCKSTYYYKIINNEIIRFKNNNDLIRIKNKNKNKNRNKNNIHVEFLAFKHEKEYIDYSFQNIEFNEIMNYIKSVLKKRNYEIFYKRIMLEMTLKSIGDEYNISAERVRQIENNAINKLKKLPLMIEYYNMYRYGRY